jgi:hypothetical protein
MEKVATLSDPAWNEACKRTLRSISKGEIMATKRTLIEPHKGDKRYIRRAANGQFTEKQVDAQAASL